MFYQEGFPISMTIEFWKEKGCEVSILHIADECLKHGWSPETTYKKMRNECDEDINKSMNNIDWKTLQDFCTSPYIIQREMIFQYLFGVSSRECIEDINKNPMVKETFINLFKQYNNE